MVIMDGLSRNLWRVALTAAASRRLRRSRVYRPALGEGGDGGAERIEPRTLLSTGLVSINAAGTAAGDNGSMLGDNTPTTLAPPPGQSAATLSADGKFLVFQSDATDLVAGLSDGNNATDVFVRNHQTGQTQLVSATPTGTVGNGRSFDPIISPNGRYVAFLSTATNLSSVAGNTPDSSAKVAQNLLYVRDLATGTTTLLDATPDGKGSNGSATGAFAFSPDSSSLAFTDSSTNLTSTPASTASSVGIPVGTVMENVYLHDLAAGTTTAVSVTPGGTLSQGNADGWAAGSTLAFSPSSGMLAFTSTATDLSSDAPAATPTIHFWGGQPATNLYVANLKAGTTALVSATPGAHFSNGTSDTPVFSPDGTLVAFLSSSTDLTSTPASSSPATPSPNGPTVNLFVHNLASGTNTAVSVTPKGTLTSGSVAQMVFSPDSTALAFVSSGTDLTGNPVDPPSSTTTPVPAPVANVYLHNLATGTTTAVSLTPGGKLSNGLTANPSFSPDGHSLAYISSAEDLTGNPAPPPQAAANGSTNSASSTAPVANLFLTNLSAGGSTTLVSVTPTGALSSGAILSYAFSPDGSKLAFDDLASDLTNNPPPAAAAGSSAGPSVSDNVFVRDLSTQSTTLVSPLPGGTLGNGVPPSFTPVFFSPDGQALYFSTASALSSTDTNGTSDIYAATAPYANPGEIHFASWQYDANEASLQAVITVVRNAPVSAAASVNYTVQDGTAHAGNDYQATSGTLNFNPGQASATFSIPLNGAASFAQLKTATITLSNPSGAPLGYPTATLFLSGIQPTVPRSITTPFWSYPQTQPITAYINTPTPSSSSGSTTPTTSSSSGSTTSSSSSHTTTPTPTSTTTTTPTSTSTSTSTTTPTATTTTTSGNAITSTLANLLQSSAASASQAGNNVNPLAVTAASTQSSTSLSAGPTVTGVTLQTTRHWINGVVVSFSKPLSSAAGGNAANYTINLLSLGRRQKNGVRPFKAGRAVALGTATLDSTMKTVTLKFSSRLTLGQMFQLRVNGGQGGITDQNGDPLNSPAPLAAGSDYVFVANQRG
jgi:hypothetical protein